MISYSCQLLPAMSIAIAFGLAGIVIGYAIAKQKYGGK